MGGDQPSPPSVEWGHEYLFPGHGPCSQPLPQLTTVPWLPSALGRSPGPPALRPVMTVLISISIQLFISGLIFIYIYTLLLSLNISGTFVHSSARRTCLGSILLCRPTTDHVAGPPSLLTWHFQACCLVPLLCPVRLFPSYFKLYLGFCLYLALVKPTDQKTTAIEKVACHSKFPGEGSRATQDHTGKHQGQSGGGRGEEEAWTGAFLVVLMGMDRADSGLPLVQTGLVTQAGTIELSL